MRFLNSSIFIRLTWNLKRIYISGHWIQPANYFWGQHWPIGQHRTKVNNKGGISKILNFHPIDWKFEEELYIWSMNSPLIIFEVKFVLWILQVLCSARRHFLVILSVCLFFCLSVNRIQVTILNRSSRNFTTW